MKPEIINPNESSLSPKPTEFLESAGELTPEIAHEMFEERLAQTEQLHPFVSLKFFYSVKEKVVREQAMARRLLKIEEDKQEIMDQYSYILNPTYFEQKLIS